MLRYIFAIRPKNLIDFSPCSDLISWGGWLTNCLLLPLKENAAHLQKILKIPSTADHVADVARLCMQISTGFLSCEAPQGGSTVLPVWAQHSVPDFETQYPIDLLFQLNSFKSE